jgi:transposase
MVADVEAGDLGPAFAGPGVQALFQGRLGRVWVFGRGVIFSRQPWRSRRVLLPPGGRVRHIDQMPVISAYLIVLSAGEEPVLMARARPVGSEYRDRLRAQIVLAAAAGQANAAIARQVGVQADTVRKWRRRFAAARLAGLKDAPRSGRPPVFTAAGRAEAVALACALPAESGVPLSKWSCPELARELAARCQVAASASTIGRWLAADALQPWQHRSWISVGDPEFSAKAARVPALPAGIWEGAPLGNNDYVICADENTSIQARCRCHPALPPGKARAMRVEHHYQRGGAVAYLAAWDVRRGQVTGRCGPTTGIAPFSRLAGQVMTTEPYARADRVFWIVDNGSSHRGSASITQMATVWPNAHLTHLPAHASWLDQAEIYFSILQRKVLSPNDFTSSHPVRDRLTAFEKRYNQIARPFSWTFTRSDLADLLHRIDAHNKTQPCALAA